MKKKIIISSLVSTLLLGTIAYPASVAAESMPGDDKEIVETTIPAAESEIDLSSFDQYVNVSNNKYVLELPSNNTYPQDTIDLLNQQIADTNLMIAENNLTIDPETKTAFLPEQGISLYAAGKTGIEFGWNYWRIFLSKDFVNTALGMGTAGASAYIASKLKVSPTISAMVTEFIRRTFGAQVSDGVWFDYNTYLITINNYGWQ